MFEDAVRGYRNQRDGGLMIDTLSMTFIHCVFIVIVSSLMLFHQVVSIGK